MKVSPRYALNESTASQVAEHLLACDQDFSPALSARVDIGDYATKIIRCADRFEAWCGKELAGLAALYCNDRARQRAYLTSVSVRQEFRAHGIAFRLVSSCIKHAREAMMDEIRLEVSETNSGALRLYRKFGFEICAGGEAVVSMRYRLTRTEQ